MENPTSKVAYFSKIVEIFSSAKMAQFDQQQRKYKIHLTF